MLHPLWGHRLSMVVKPAALFACSLLILHAGVTVHGLRQHCVTTDEGGHILDGVMAWERGIVGIYRVNPPLVKLLAALPVVASHPHLPEQAITTPVTNWEWLHFQFARVNRSRYQELVNAARYMITALSVLGGWLVYRWATGLFGVASGLVALFLWILCPNVLAWSGIVTVDLGATVFGLISALALRQYIRKPSLREAIWTGLTLALAVLSKYSLLVMYPLCLGACIIPAFSSVRDNARQKASINSSGRVGLVFHLLGRPSITCLSHIIVMTVATLIAINLMYAWEGTGRRLGTFAFQCDALTYLNHESRHPNCFEGTLVAALPVPLPESYVLGLDDQKARADRGAPAFLHGEWRDGGWWYYYLYGLAIKLPLGTLVFTAMACLLAICSPRFRAGVTDEVVVWVPPIVILVLISSQTGINGHLRYALPAFPFLFIGISRVGILVQDLVAEWGQVSLVKHFQLSFLSRLASSPRRIGLLLGSSVVVGGILYNSISVLRCHPHYVSYFNELVGGPDEGWRYLIESNVDWGQDLLFVKKWVDQHPEARPMFLAYYGGLDPHLTGLTFQQAPWGPVLENRLSVMPLFPDLGPRPGWYAVSVNLLSGMEGEEYTPRGERFQIPRNVYCYFQLFQPVYKAGYSIFIYHIERDEANRVRRLLGLPPLDRQSPDE